MKNKQGNNYARAVEYGRGSGFTKLQRERRGEKQRNRKLIKLSVVNIKLIIFFISYI